MKSQQIAVFAKKNTMMMVVLSYASLAIIHGIFKNFIFNY